MRKWVMIESRHDSNIICNIYIFQLLSTSLSTEMFIELIAEQLVLGCIIIDEEFKQIQYHPIVPFVMESLLWNRLL